MSLLRAYLWATTKMMRYKIINTPIVRGAGCTHSELGDLRGFHRFWSDSCELTQTYRIPLDLVTLATVVYLARTAASQDIPCFVLLKRKTGVRSKLSTP